MSHRYEIDAQSPSIDAEHGEKLELALENLDEQVQVLFEKFKLNLAPVKEALSMLKNLDEGLKYHSIRHTHEVMKHAIRLALADNQPMNVIELQVTAAAWHDVGYLWAPKKNEVIAIDQFKKNPVILQCLAEGSLTQEDVDVICAEIGDTEVHYEPSKGPYLNHDKSRYGYVLDADVINFGTTDFFEKGELLAQEQNLNLVDPTIALKFYKNTLLLLTNHKWKTPAGRRLHQEQKERNMAELRKIIADLQ